MKRNDISYHRWRAEREAEAAEGSGTEHVRQVHRQLASLHSARADQLEGERDQRVARLR